ncbi:MAG: hypothetical protein COA78_24220 [Blastopirellula sp.]|nr:MAG: hypothetical protein COA78_24220 [Blastopirellula sp.]
MSTATKENVSKKTTKSKATKPATANKPNTPVGKSSAPAKQSSSTDDDSGYINQRSHGFAYINSISEFVDNGKNRTHLHMSVLQGPVKNIHYEYHRLLVVSDYAYEAILKYREAIETKGVKVFISFNMVNPHVEKYIKRSGDDTGEFAACIGGILTRVLTIKVDGELVFEDTRTFDKPNAQNHNSSGSSFDDDIPF